MLDEGREGTVVVMGIVESHEKYRKVEWGESVEQMRERKDKSQEGGRTGDLKKERREWI